MGGGNGTKDVNATLYKTTFFLKYAKIRNRPT